MSESEKEWNEVGDGFKKLGALFKQHYEAQGQEAPPEGEEPAESVSEEEVKDAVHTIGESLKTAFASLGDAVRDPEVKEEAKQTARSFFDALGATINEIGDEITKWREKQKAEEEPPSRTDAAPAEPPAEQEPED